MNENEIEKCAGDNSASVTFSINITVENGRLTPEARKLIASLVSRGVVTMSLSLERIVSDRFDIAVQKRSSALGIVDLDAGMMNE